MSLQSVILRKWFSNVSTLFLRTQWVVLGLALLCLWPARADVTDDNYADKIRRSRFVGQPLVWIGDAPPSEQESRVLWEAMGAGQSPPRPDIAASLEGFVKAHPQSPWRASIEDRLGTYYQDSGYFSLALSHWEASWNAAKGMKDAKGTMESAQALIHWLQLLATLGRTDMMKSLFDETKGRAMPGLLRNTYTQMERAYQHMLLHPEDSYRCGTFALNAVGQALYGANHYREIVRLDSPESGFSMASLMEIAASNHLDLVAMQRPSGAELVAPSVVHWKENHYAAIVEKKGDVYRVVDPTFLLSRWLSADAINHEASGQFLVPAKQRPADWRDLSMAECAGIFGKGWGETWAPPENPPCDPGSNCCDCCPPGGGGGGPPGGGPPGGGPPGGGPPKGGAAALQQSCSSCQSSVPQATGGMPNWEVTEPNNILWITDEPLAYQTATGGRMSFKIYRHDWWGGGVPDGDYPSDGGGISFGDECWRASWMSYVLLYGGVVNLYPPGGGARIYTNYNGTTPEYYTKTRMLGMTNSGNPVGFNVLYPSGAKDVYAFNYGGDNLYFLLSQQIDAHGRTTTYVYNTNTSLLQYVIDCDGNTNTFSYTANPMMGNSNLVGRITNPYGRSVTFSYYTNTYTGNSLSNMVDPDGISTTFTFSDDWCTVLTNMTTPYGTTTFYFANQSSSNYDRFYPYCRVAQPDGGQQLFVFGGGTTFPYVPLTYTNASNVPTNRPADNALGTNTLDNPDWNNPPSGYGDYMNWANSYYWNRAQYTNLSTGFLNNPTNFDALVANDYANARLRHWNQYNGNQGLTLSMEQLPSPAVGTPGNMTWWDYPNKPLYNQQGSSAFPSLVIRVQPDGSEWYQMYQTDPWGNRTNIISTYSSNGVVLLRTNAYLYSTNTVDLLQVIRPDGVTDAAYGYNTNHQVLFMTNAMGYVTSYTYNTNQQLTSMTEPTGLVTTNIYNSGNRLATTYSYAGGLYFGTNSYTYTNDLVYTHTDERGLTTTSSWDSLERLTNLAYPDGTHLTYVYSNLDLVEIVDRLGFTNTFAYDKIERRISATDANGHTTYYGYCNCGGVDYITNALGQVTQFVYDNQGNVTAAYFPDGYSLFNTFNSIRQLIVRTDGAGVSVTNWFNNQGGLIAVSNAAGSVLNRTYDVDDRVVNTVDHNGVATAMTYDNLMRMLSRSYPDGGVERFGYSTFGLIAYTNQLTNITYYTYDAARRKIAETNALAQVTQYGYSPASDVISLTDAKSDMTRWGYDLYGRVTNKVDATSTTILKYQYDADDRLTNRWSLAMGNTVYAYDDVANLTSVTYVSSPALSFSYDNMNELTSMSDGVGTTAFTYTPAGQLASENGPWPSDQVAYSYTDRLRTALDLQQPNASSWVQDYVYDLAARMTGITSPAGTFAYTYNTGLAGTTTDTSLITKIALPNGAFITNTYDNNARMLGTWLTNSVNNLDSSVYTYNVGNQRTTVQRTGENTATYTYDPIGQIIADQASEVTGGAARWNEQLHYAFDSAGNLNYRTNNTLIENFQVNSVNELTENTNGGRLTVMGTTTSPATNVTVNGTNAQFYGDATFAATNLPLTTTYSAAASDSYGRHSTNTVTVSIATSTAFQYDGNGNLTNDGLRCFAYDDENQLKQVWVANKWFSQFTYDGRMRRRIRQEFTWQGSGWMLTNEVYYVYDGNVVVQERNLNNLPTTTYTRGQDLSGNLENAGGIGGLLSMTLNTSSGPLNSNSMFYHSDANGNVTMLINPAQSIVAKYLYDAFGNILSKSGLFADANLYRLSSKEAHLNSGLVYHLYRFYDTNLQRWINRDPIQEAGGLNLYGFVGNRAPNETDFLGLVDCGALEQEIDDLEARLGNGGYGNQQALERRIDALRNIWSRFCWKPPPDPPSQPNTCPPPGPVKLPPHSQNHTITPPNLWHWVPPFIILIIIPWPGNPIYGGL
jgi:RHS repeat-associated protein